MDYRFAIHGLRLCQQHHALLVLETAERDYRLQIAVDAQDAEAFRAENAGTLTLRSRMGFALALILERIGVALPGVHLRCSAARQLEAYLLLERGDEPCHTAINPIDALALARLRDLPITGDGSLAPWLQPIEPDPIPLSPPVVAFLSALAAPAD
ncbi:MAG TPA: hypothetical protein VGE07_27685 [Herpetosiphonaceae bacterium]